MSFFGKIVGKKKEKYVLSLDIGTEFVKALVSCVDYDKMQITNIGIGKSRQTKGSIFGGKILDSDEVVKTCKKAIDEAYSEAGVSPREVILGFSGNIIKIHTSSFEVERKNFSSKINSNELKTIVDNAYKNSLSGINNDIKYREKIKGVKVIGSDISDFVIDGYRIINPLNFKGKKIKIGVVSSYVLNSDFVLIGKIVEKLKLNLFKISYIPYAVLKAIGGRDVLGFNAIMVDVGGNITDLAFVKNGNVYKSDMFAIGGNAFTKRIAHNFNVKEDGAEDLKIKYSNGLFTDKEDSSEIKKALSQDIDLWYSGVEISLDTYDKGELLPSRFFVFGGGSKLPDLISSINNLKEKSFPFSGDIKINFISADDIPDNINKINEVDDLQEVPLICLAHLCFDSAVEEDIPNQILEKTILNK